MGSYKFKSLHEVPINWRTYKGARFSLDQIQSIVDESVRTTGNNSGLASARNNFERTHHIVNDIWVNSAPKIKTATITLSGGNN